MPSWDSDTAAPAPAAPNGPWWDQSAPGFSYKPLTDDQKSASIGKFKTQVAAHPDWLTPDGTFKPPTAGVNYSLEGRRPDDVIANALHPYQRPETDGGGFFNSPQFTDLAFTKEGDLNAGWRQGPDNGGGGLGGFARAIGNTATGIAHNPALMAGITAGIGQYLAPATVGGDVSAAAQLGGNADKAALYGSAGYGAEPSMLQSFAASPYARPLMSAGKTLASGGNLSDALKSGVVSYAGQAAGDEALSETGSKFAGTAATQLTQAGLSGHLDQGTLAGLATQYLSGQLTDLTGLPPGVASSVLSLARGKKLNPGALTQLAVGSAGLQKTVQSGAVGSGPLTQTAN